MKNKFQTSIFMPSNLKNITSKLLIFCMMLTMAFGSVSCNSQKKLAEQKRIEALAKTTAKAKSDLQALLNDDTKTAAEKEAALNRIKGLNLEDPEVQALIAKVEADIVELKKKEAEAAAEEAKRRAEEEAKRKAEAETKDAVDYFNDIANASSVDQANASIAAAMKLFADNADVLIIVSKYGEDDKDYDKPVKIKEYLNYLKDKKKFDKKVESVKKSPNGKITEIELIKQ